MLARDAWGIGRPDLIWPEVSAHPGEAKKRRNLRRGGAELLVAQSLGVGGRKTKRLGGAFEDALLELLRKVGFRILLDYGSGEEEARNVARHLAAFSGSTSHLVSPGDGRDKCADLMTIRGTLGSFASWMAGADVFIGYDSAAAHVAAAQEVPLIEVFAGAPNDLFRKRWTPYGYGTVCVIPADGREDAPRVLGRIEKELMEIRERGGRNEPWRWG